MRAVIGWTGPGDDARWEAAEEADYRADRRRKAEDRAALMSVEEDRATPTPLPPGTCQRCRGNRTVPQRAPRLGLYAQPYWEDVPCPECAA